MAWSDLLAAFAIYLVLEGLLPFLNPDGYRRAMASISALDNRVLRIVGLVSMIAGAVLLSFVRGPL